MRFTLWSFGCLDHGHTKTRSSIPLILTLIALISCQRRHVFLCELDSFIKLLFLIKYSIQNHLNLGNVILSVAVSHLYLKRERIAVIRSIIRSIDSNRDYSEILVGDYSIGFSSIRNRD